MNINNFLNNFRQTLNSIDMRISLNKRELILIFLGSFFIFLGLIAYFGLPILILTIIHQQLLLEPNTEASNIWKDIPIPIYQRIYFFNVTNPTDIERLGAKPKVVEMGPYTYRSKWTKSLEYNKNGTVTYKEKKTYYFVRELSSGDESDIITSVNGPLVITLSLLQSAPSAVRVIVTLALDAVTEGFFIRRTVNQLLFDGYPDLLTTFGPLLNPKITNSNGRFGWIYGRNKSDEGAFTVFTGKDSIDKLNIIDKFKGKNRLDFWREKSFCNSLKDSTDGQMFPPIKDTKKSLFLFHPDFCRKWKMNFDSEIEKHGITAYRYKPDPNLFLNADDYPPNACYGSRLPTTPNPSLFTMQSSTGTSSVRQRKIRFNSGVFDMSSCKYGAPIIMSYPHFLTADPVYAESIEGIKADPSKHEFYLDVEPTTGTSLGNKARLQINIFLNKPPGMFRYRNVPEIVFPVFWQELSANVSSKMTERLSWALQQPTLISSISSTSMLFIGILCLLSSLLFPFYDNYFKNNKTTKESGSVVYTDKTNANSQVDINRIIINETNNKQEENGIDNKALDPN